MFIELTLNSDDSKISVNSMMIRYIHSTKGNTTRVEWGGSAYVEVQETYDEVKKLIEDIVNKKERAAALAYFEELKGGG